MTTPTTTDRGRRAPLPPRWVIRAAWTIHRAIYALTLGRMGLRRQTPERWGMMRLTTVGRRSGSERHAILGYFEDGPNLVTMAMNGWGEAEPAWWLNLQANPDTTVELPTARARSAAVRPHRRSGPACGRAGPSTTARRSSRAGQRADRGKPRSSSSSRGRQRDPRRAILGRVTARRRHRRDTHRSLVVRGAPREDPPARHPVVRWRPRPRERIGGKAIDEGASG